MTRKLSILMLIPCHALALIACSPAAVTHPDTSLSPSEIAPPSSPDHNPTEVPAETTETTTPLMTSTTVTEPTSERKAAPDAGDGSLTKDGPAKASQSGTPPQGRPYTWQDGDRTITVLLQPNLEVGVDGKITARPSVLPDNGNLENCETSHPRNLPTGLVNPMRIPFQRFQCLAKRIVTVPKPQRDTAISANQQSYTDA